MPIPKRTVLTTPQGHTMMHEAVWLVMVEGAVGDQEASCRLKLRVERRPFLAPEAVIFGVIFTGPYSVPVNCLFELGPCHSNPNHHILWKSW
ncbi:hypothetical protein N7495_008196 [Penicillium taxi]|uniref:uncharacterized protein n=1 Tax=Penicillium taxi TaxID=168475 RepID=UPI0025458C09|nr:uncharacterized protein N7495_008196 [Penicillium taxi]KAJ5888155.1 hypothetical protein N7495_008196 [Penicillium taxi]